MKDVTELIVTQIRVYEADQLPFHTLRLQSNLRSFAKMFNFGSVALDPLGLQVVLSNGAVEIEKQSIHIQTLTLEPRRMLLQVRGRSSDANAAASSFSAELEKLSSDSPKGQRLQPILVSDETACVATLEIDFSDLIVPPLVNLIEGEARTMFGNKYFRAKSVSFKNLSFEVRYEPTNGTLQEYDVSLANKLLTLEPRQGTPLRERRFYVSSPSDSEIHIALLEALEAEVLRFHQSYQP